MLCSTTISSDMWTGHMLEHFTRGELGRCDAGLMLELGGSAGPAPAALSAVAAEEPTCGDGSFHCFALQEIQVLALLWQQVRGELRG